MKNLLVLVVIVGLFSCKGVDQYKAGVEGLGTQWDAATSAVTEFSGMLNAEDAKYGEMLASMAIAPEVMAKLKPADQDSINAAGKACAAAGSGYKAMIAEAGAFVTDWTAKTAEIQALKDGLAAGKLDGDVAGKIASLTTAAKDGVAKLDGWKTAFEGNKATCAESMTKYQALVAKFIPAKK